MSLISIIKLSIGEIQLDNNNNLLILKFTDQNYNKEDFNTMIEYFKNFWILAGEQNKKYYMLFDIKELGMYPIQQFDNFRIILQSLEDVFLKSLHSSALLTENQVVLTILKPLFTIYKSVRPFSIFKKIEEVKGFFNKAENINCV